MKTRTVGRLTLTEPDLDEPGTYLSIVDSLDCARGVRQDFRYADGEMRALDLADVQLVSGRVTALTAGRVRFQEVSTHSVEFSDCDLRALQWIGGKLTRTTFRNCRIMGGTLTDLALDDVLFEDCRLDYTTFERVRTSGTAVFTGCMLAEASFTDCDLRQAALRDCALRLTEFGAGRYEGIDLRENGLSAIHGAAHLEGALVDRQQESELAQALISALHLTYDGDT